MRPTSFMAPICAMPTTTVVKMIGAISIRTSLMKPSPSGRIAAPSPAPDAQQHARGDADEHLDVEAFVKRLPIDADGVVGHKAKDIRD